MGIFHQEFVRSVRNTSINFIISDKLKFIQMRKVYFVFILAAVLFVSNSSLHPSGNTGAPGESFCGSCHQGSGGALDGEIIISGLPSTIMPSTTYPIEIKVTNPALNASRAGFQIVALNQSNNNVGTFSNFNSSTSALRMQNGRTYLGHKPAQFFSGANELTWTTDWTSPAGNNGDQITIYGATVIANGAGGNNGDRSRLTNVSTTLISSSPLSISVNEVSPVSCFDSDDGIAEAVVSGGVSPYNYLWDNNETQMTATNLTIGFHQVTVTDFTGESIVGDVTLSGPNPLIGSIDDFTDVSCFGNNDGSAALSANGGTSPYSFSWPDGQNLQNRNNLQAGLYNVTISDFQNCSTTLDVQINEPDQLSLQETIINNTCFGESNASIELEVTGGTGSYNYLWENNQTSSSRFDLPQGTYEVTVTDENDCSITQSFDIIDPVEIILQKDITHPLCHDEFGEISLELLGGNPAMYQWNDGSSASFRNDLKHGTYTVTVEDGNGCQKIDTIALVEPPQITIDSIHQQNASCQDSNSGYLQIAYFGGTGNLLAEWSNDAIGINNFNLSFGNYDVSVTDDNNCTSTRSFTIFQDTCGKILLDTIVHISCNGGSDGYAIVYVDTNEDYIVNWSNGTIGDTLNNVSAGSYSAIATDKDGFALDSINIQIHEPNSIKLDSTKIIEPTCYNANDGSIELFASGGTGTLLYNWFHTDTSTANLDSLSAGSYEVNIVDELGCSLLDTLVLSSPDPLSLDSIHIQNINCFGDSTGSITTYYSGGTSPYTYLWSNGDSVSNINNLSKGHYTLTLIDSNLCIKTDSFQLFQSSELEVSGEITNTYPGLSNGSISLNITGGTSPYEVNWSNGMMSDTISDLDSGYYHVTITDSLGCTKSDSFIIIADSCLLNAHLEIEDASCFYINDGSIAIEYDQNIGPVQIEVIPSASSLDSLGSGTYQIILTDSANCSLVFDSIVVLQPDSIVISIDSILPSDNSFNGAIYSSVLGGVPPYQFSWMHESGTMFSDSLLEDVGPGIYSLVISDALGCNISIDSIEIPFVSSTSSVQTEIKIYPNPINDVLWLKGNKYESYTLRNGLGKIVKSIMLQNTIEQIDMSNLPPGMYYLSSENSTQRFIQKLIKN